MRRLRRIKILATLGPVSSDSAMIRRLFEAGADVFRINMSHTSHDKMRELVKTIRNVESSYGRPIGILVDLQGPKLRVGSFAEGSIQLNNGESFVLDSDKTPGDNTRVQLPHPEILAALRPGHALLLDDGKVRLIVEETTHDRAVTNNRQNLQKQSVQRKQPVQRAGQSKIHPSDERRASGRAVVQISQAQRTHIRDAFRQHPGNFRRVANVGFPFFVGASVPNDYRYYDVSSDFAEYAPEYEGYKYIVVGDELLIIDPRTWEIVADIPV